MTWNPALPVVTTKLKSGPGIFQDNWLAFDDWTSNSEHHSITDTLSGQHKPGLCSMLFIGATGDFPGTNVACAAGFDTTLKVFKYNTGAAWTNIGGPIVSGTIMLFYQDTAPTGWTIDDTKDSKLVFITKGSAAGGEVGGGAHSTGTWTFTGHTHVIATHNHTGTTGSVANSQTGWSPFEYPRSVTETHTHTIPGQELTSDANADVSSWRPAAYCVIQCEKD